MELVKNRREGRVAGAAGAGNAAGHYEEGDYSGRVRKGKMKQQDMAGSISTDRQNLRLAELQLLFKVRSSHPVLHAGTAMEEVIEL